MTEGKPTPARSLEKGINNKDAEQHQKLLNTREGRRPRLSTSHRDSQKHIPTVHSRFILTFNHEISAWNKERIAKFIMEEATTKKVNIYSTTETP